jgi:hypothetical protein
MKHCIQGQEAGVDKTTEPGLEDSSLILVTGKSGTGLFRWKSVLYIGIIDLVSMQIT